MVQSHPIKNKSRVRSNTLLVSNGPQAHPILQSKDIYTAKIAAPKTNRPGMNRSSSKNQLKNIHTFYPTMARARSMSLNSAENEDKCCPNCQNHKQQAIMMQEAYYKLLKEVEMMKNGENPDVYQATSASNQKSRAQNRSMSNFSDKGKKLFRQLF